MPVLTVINNVDAERSLPIDNSFGFLGQNLLESIFGDGTCQMLGVGLAQALTAGQGTDMGGQNTVSVDGYGGILLDSILRL